MRASDELTDRTVELYCLPLEEFTTARDALSKQLRQQGDRVAAQTVKQLRKPTVAAWSLNRVRHRDGQRIAELLDAGARLREAQARLLSVGDRDGLRDASARERQLIDSLVADAEAELAGAGHPPNATIRNRLFCTLHAIAGDEQVRSLLAAGMLARDYEASDFGFAIVASALPLETKPPTQTAETPTTDASAQRQIETMRNRLGGARATQAARRQDLDRADQALKEANDKATSAQERLRHAERELASATDAQRAAEQAAETARGHQRHADELVGDLEANLQRLLGLGG